MEFISDGQPLQRLRLTAVAAFPAHPAVRTVDLSAGVDGFWESLLRATGLPPEAACARLAEQIHCEAVAAAELGAADPRAAMLVPQVLAEGACVLALRLEQGRLVVASANPFDVSELQRIRFACNKELQIRLAPPDAIRNHLPAAYGRAAELQSVTLTESAAPGAMPAAEAVATAGEQEANAVVALARTLLHKAITAGASDLHLQPYAGGGVCRLRIDGVLRRISFVPDATLWSLVRFFKVNAGMDSANHLIAQDGRMSMRAGTREYDLRLSVVPASRGERLVIRLLNQSRVHSLADADISTANLNTVRRLLLNTDGVILLTGPTGAGKTSTLHALLHELNVPGINVMTVEDPVEYRVPGISQVEVNPKAGLTFASALRSMLRQDPDVILVGETRDQETAELMMQAALTGHLVLSTLHTTSALGAVPRLADLGISPAVMADAIRGVIGQRLLRRLCPACRQLVAGDDLRPHEAAFEAATGERPTYRAHGCAACDHEGYAGRFAVLEVLEVTPEVARCIRGGDFMVGTGAGGTIEGFAPLAHTAALRVISGDTSVDEVARVLGHRFWAEAAAIFNRPVPTLPARATGFGRPLAEAADVLVFALRPVFADACAKALKEESFAPVVEHRVEDVRAALQANPHLGLLVVDLEGDAGTATLQLLLELRRATAWSRLPAVVVLPAGDTESAQLLAGHGYTDVFFKPVDLAEVAGAARQLVNR